MVKEINDQLVTIYLDFATVRRFLIDYRFMIRSVDGKQYWIDSKTHANT
ncbi:DUF2087 domain-containing protein [Sporosarcina sp. E16_8]|nr:DUF2087 domain-containing protein [Sporosarcina sp. E16_8]MBO0587648.1 DUF2087 domain-containing protein [Sporosarcina sp. E16_8]